MKDQLEQIKQEAKAGIQSFQSIIDIVDSLEGPEKYARIISAYWDNGKIIVEFEANVDIDIHYWFGDKVHEVEDYVGEIEQTGRFEIGVNQYDKNWNVQVVGEEVESEVWNVGAFQKPELPDKKIFLGWWNPFKTSEEALKLSNCNLVEDAREETVKEAIKWGKVIPMIGGFGATGTGRVTTDHLIKKRASEYYKHLEKYKDDILYVAVQDEPWGRAKFDNRQVQVMMDAASTMDVPVGLTITRSNALNEDDIIPESTDWIQIQAFPFFRDDIEKADQYPQVWNKKDFMDYWDNLLTKVQKKLERPMIITAQGFYNDRWRKPPDESLLWYYELAQIYGFVKGITVYAWHDKTGKGVNTMPEYFESITKILI